jgi:hypothetical protein
MKLLSQFITILLVVLALAALAGTAAAGGRPFSTRLTGAAEVPGPGDPARRVWHVQRVCQGRP